MNIEFQPIGFIHTPYADPKGMTIQPPGGAGGQGTVEVLPEFRKGLRELDGFSHLILLYHFHRNDGYELRVTPFMGSVERGLFATRPPRRLNAIGLSDVEFIKIEDGILHVENVDVLDGKPLLGTKPYVLEFDERQDVRTGWLESVRRTVSERRSDDRFEKEGS